MKCCIFFQTILYFAFCFTGVSAGAQTTAKMDSLLEQLPTLEDDTAKLVVYGRISRMYLLTRDQNDLARQYADSMSLLARKMNFEKGLVDSYYRHGAIESFEGNYFKALEYYNKYLMFYESRKDTYRIVNVLFAIGKLYKSLGEFDKSLENFYRAVTICEETNDQEGLAMAWNSISGIERQMGNHGEAIDHYTRANEIYQALGLNYLGRTYLKRGDYALANSYLNEGLLLAQELQSKDLLHGFYQALSDVSSANHDYKNAYNFSKLSHQWKDSIFNEETAKQMSELQTKYETEKKTRQIAFLEQETQRQSTIKKAFIGGFILMTLLAVSIIYTINQRFKNQKQLVAKDNEIKEANFKKQLSELELKALRAQINPHFLYNCMNSINRMILENENESASQYLAKFSKLVRLILENSEKPTVSLRNELTMLEAYIKLEGLRFKGRIDYTISVDENLDPDAIFLPSMVLQPFVENAIWHGLMNRKNGSKGLLKIAVKEENEILNLTIEDNGIGREAARELREKSVLKTESMGIKITEERLKLIAQKNRGKLIRIVDLKNQLNEALGTRVEITVPLYNRV